MFANNEKCFYGRWREKRFRIIQTQAENWSGDWKRNEFFFVDDLQSAWVWWNFNFMFVVSAENSPSLSFNFEASKPRTRNNFHVVIIIINIYHWIEDVKTFVSTSTRTVCQLEVNITLPVECTSSTATIWIVKKQKTKKENCQRLFVSRNLL